MTDHMEPQNWSLSENEKSKVGLVDHGSSPIEDVANSFS